MSVTGAIRDLTRRVATLERQVKRLIAFDVETAAGSLSDDKLLGWVMGIEALIDSVTLEYAFGGYSDISKHAFTFVTAEVVWPDGSLGHFDGIEFEDQPGILQYFTASHEDSGKIVKQLPLYDGVAGRIVITPDVYIDSSAAAGGDGSFTKPYNGLTVTPTANQIIAIKSGSTFYNQTLSIGGAADGVEIYRYGSGAKPLIDCGLTFDSGAWTLSGGRVNAYQQTVTIELHASTSFVLVTEADNMLVRVADAATCEATAGSYAVSTDTGSGNTSVTVYVHPAASGNPGTNGITYRYSRRLYAIDGLGADQVTLDGIRAQLPAGNDGAIRLGKQAEVRHCHFNYGGKHNALVGEGSTVAACKFNKAYHNVNGIMLVFYSDTFTGSASYVYECQFEQSAYLGTIDGIYAHRGVSGTSSWLYISRVYMQFLDNGINAIQVAGISVQKSMIIECREAMTSAVDFIADGIAIYALGTHCQRIYSANAAATVTLDRIYANHYPNANGLIFSSSAVAMTVRYCQLKAAGGRGIYLTNAGSTLNHYDNSFAGTWGQQMLMLTGALTLSSNRNIYPSEYSAMLQYNGVNYATLAAWQTATGQDLYSSVGGPADDKIPS